MSMDILCMYDLVIDMERWNHEKDGKLPNKKNETKCEKKEKKMKWKG